MNSETMTIESEELVARFIPFGASLTDLRFKQDNVPLVLGYGDPTAYAEDGQFMGAVIGRYANRIAGGLVKLDDGTVQLERNENNKNHLHGGTNGFSTQTWKAEKRSENNVVFSINSLAGEAGYPGNLSVSAHYEIVDQAILRLSFIAQSDADTVINICHHPYFNFSGSRLVGDHTLLINSAQYLPSHQDLIPTGEIANVSSGPFDFRSARKLSDQNYNNTYCLHGKQSGALAHAATLSGGSVSMELWTTQPGLHLYNGYKLGSSSIGHGGEAYVAKTGICLEAQAWPDSPNKSGFPNVVLQAGETYIQTTEYRLSKTI